MSASADSVLLDVNDGIAHLRLNRPSAGNALDLDMSRSLAEALRRIGEDPTAKVVILSGSGAVFCAGGDVAQMHASEDHAGFLRELANEAHIAARLLAQLDRPVIAAVNGAAAGAGLSLALLSDIVLSHAEATFVTAYASVGLSPDCGQSWLLPRAVGEHRALDLLLRPRGLRADEAQDIGLVADITDDDAVPEAISVAAQLLKKSAPAAGLTRRLIRAAEYESFSAQLDREAETIAQAAATPEAGQLIANFVERAR